MKNLKLLYSDKVNQIFKKIRFHLFETDDVFIYWPDFNKGILLLLFALCIIPSHLLWYVLNFESENRIWLNESYHDYRMLTTAYQYFLTLFILIISLKFQRYKKFRSFMGWFIPLYFGLLLLYSAQTIGLYSPAAMGGILNILLIGFVFYKPKIIYSITVIISLVFFLMCYFIKIEAIPYAPLFSEELNSSDLYSNTFWLKSMAILYLPILVISALFFEILLRQWRRREKKIEVLSQIDGLTYLYNRRYVNDYIQGLHLKNKHFYAMVILDLDYFKIINDSYGHDAGDEVLRCVAQILKGTVRENDLVGRFGGEEFVLILPDADLEIALDVAERCRKKIGESKIAIEGLDLLSISASFGVAVSKEHVGKEQIARQADQALYFAKQQGRNQVRHFEEL